MIFYLILMSVCVCVHERMHHMVWCDYTHTKIFLKINLHMKDIYKITVELQV